MSWTVSGGGKGIPSPSVPPPPPDPELARLAGKEAGEALPSAFLLVGGFLLPFVFPLLISVRKRPRPPEELLSRIRLEDRLIFSDAFAGAAHARRKKLSRVGTWVIVASLPLAFVVAFYWALAFAGEVAMTAGIWTEALKGIGEALKSWLE